MGGSIIRTVTAIELPDLAIPLEVTDATILGRVFRLSEKMRLPPVCAQALWKLNSTRVSQAGFARGITICQNILNALAPSILAASIRAGGILDSIDCFIRKMPIVLAREGNM